ncbi:EAL domain-containing protein [Sulfurimonas sp. HSL-1716]|uniref:EAL domain-containing response regulator n=1 Tax=Hydrocurvibacter sulfurireducens TaxID=3131937 RepID=UPI0031F98D18
MNIDMVKQLSVLGNSLSVLYVEDDPVVMGQISKMLRRVFNDLDTIDDSIEALRMHKEKKYDLVLMDIMMKNMDGIELSRKLIKENTEQSIIIISAYKNENELLKLIDLGISGFISKPIDQTKFLHTLLVKVKKIHADKMMHHHYNELKYQIDKNKDNNKRIYYQDTLTSAFNQKYLHDVLQKKNVPKSAILININDFKLINNYYSYLHGNDLLSQFVILLNTCETSSQYDVFRMSADEFILLYKDQEDDEKIRKDAQFLTTHIESKRFSIIGVKDINITVTMGIVNSTERILEKLSQALLYAKKHHLKYAFYDDDHQVNSQMYNIIKTKNILQKSIENNLIIPVYQPIQTKSDQLNYEVLMRIKHDNNELLSPDKFMSVAKEHSYYNQISQILVCKALDEITKSKNIFSINLTYQDIKNNDFMNKLEEKIIKNKIGQRLIFEIVESDLIEDMDILESFLKRFKAHGVKVAIDDFGTGYSNFLYILKINPDYIKLDGNLIVNIVNDKAAFTLVQTIIGFAHKLNIEVIAEHVSTKEIYDILKKLDVDAVQGYYIGRPDINYIESA